MNISNLSSAVAFARKGSGRWPEWERYLVVHGEPAFLIGNICGTCEFFFERIEEASNGVDVEELSGTLAAGIDHIHPEVANALGKLLPSGSYHLVLMRLTPHLIAAGSDADYFAHEQVQQIGFDPVMEGGTHHPRIDYYRVKPTEGLPVIGDQDRTDLSFDFIIPLHRQNQLDEERIRYYMQRLEEAVMPTAVAVSVLDVKQPEIENVQDHRCMGHYLLDGHHKLAAAARTGKPLTLLSFIANDQGVSNSDDLQKYLNLHS